MLQISLSERSTVPLVTQIVDAVRSQIDDRLLRPGARLPPIRRMADTHRISRFTVVEAYERLVALGYLRSQRGSGFYVAQREIVRQNNANEPTCPRVIDTAWMMRQALEEHPGVLKIGTGWIPPNWLEPETLGKMLRSLTRSANARLSCYGPPKGYRPLREQLQIRLEELEIGATPEQIILTAGATQAVDLAARYLLRPGDAVLVDDPGYHNLFGNLRLLGARLIGVPRGADGPDIAALETLAQAHKPKAFFTHSVLHNPTGTNLAPATAYRVLQAAERHNFMIVEDDAYGALSATNMPRLAALDQLQRVIYIGSFSKTLSPNLRVGFLAAHPQIAEHITDLKLLTAVSTSELAEQVIYRLLTEGHYRKHIERLRGRLAEAAGRSIKTLERVGMKIDREPQGGVFIWARMPQGDDATALAENAEKEGIILAPGKVFRPHFQASPYLRFHAAYSNHVRLERFLNEAFK